MVHRHTFTLQKDADPAPLGTSLRDALPGSGIAEPASLASDLLHLLADVSTVWRAFSPDCLAFALLGFSCAFALCWLLLGLISVSSIEHIFAESGPVETASALFLLVTGGILIGHIVRSRDLSQWHLAVLAVAAALRELDWDKAFTDRGVLPLGLYSGDAPLMQKIIAGIVVVLILWAGIRLLRRGLGKWLAACKRFELWPYLVAGAISLAVVAKTLDGLARKLAGVGIEISENASRLASQSEEVLELLAAIILVQATGLYVIRAVREER